MKPAHQRLAFATAGVALLACLLLILLRPEKQEQAPAHPPKPSPPPPTSVAGTEPEPPPSAPAAKPAKSTPEPKEAAPAKSRYTRLTIKAGQPIPELFPFQAERDRLTALGSTYDARNIPVIAPSLSHSEATVREAARQALVQIGDPSAVPYLKRAKDAARDPAEAETLQETIDFLSLPHVIDVLSMKPTASSTPKP